MVFFSIFEKDYKHGNEFTRFREGSLGEMNKIEPKIKFSALPLSILTARMHFNKTI